MNSNIKTRAQVTDSSNDAIDSLSRATMITMGSVSGFVGLWSVACLASAMVGSGPIGLIKAWFSAVAGI